MKNKIIIPIIFTLILFSIESYSQEKNQNTLQKTQDTLQKIKDTLSVEWERPFNFFAAAGASYMFGNHYSIAVSPIDNTVQFDRTFPVLTRFSLGLVWNPIPEKGDNYVNDYIKNKKIQAAYKASRKYLAIALLVNVLQLSYSNDFNASSPIDVGFGLGYRNDNLLILLTVELTPLRTPRTYFTEQYKDKNLPFVLSGSTVPVRTISSDDNALFISKIFPSIGVKIAYSFTNKNKK